MRENKIVDLTEGNIPSQILLFSLPILMGNLFQTLYNNVDSLVVGNFVGKEALAAVNTCTPVANLLIGFFVGMATGASVIFSRSFGARDYSRLKNAIHTTLLFALILGIAMAVAGLLLVRFILNILNCQPDIYEYTREYLTIYLAGLIFTAFYNVCAAVLRSVGDSRSPFLALVAASLINIVLDLVFVVKFGMGVAGVAFATVISQIISVGICGMRMRTMDPRYCFEIRALRINRGLLGEILSYGIPAGLQTSLISISNLFVNRYINGFGSVYMAGVGVGQKLDRFISLPIMSIGLAATTFTAQNIGARKKERIRRGIAVCYTLCLIMAVAVGIPFYRWADRLVMLFNRDPGVVSCGSDMMRILIPCYFIMAANHLFAGVLRGYGYTTPVMAASVAGMIGCRQIFLCISMAVNPTIVNVYVGYPVGWFFAAVGVILLYVRYRKTGQLDRRFETGA